MATAKVLRGVEFCFSIIAALTYGLQHMKNLTNSLAPIALPLLMILIGISGCRTREAPDTLRVGMTYDEVENILGKPNQIARGVNELTYDAEQLTREEIRTSHTVREDSYPPNQWVVRRVINTTGALMYVTWVYDQSKYETCWVHRKNFSVVYDTIPVKEYFINGERVSKDDYDLVDEYAYFRTTDASGQYISKREWERLGATFPDLRRGRIKAEKRIISRAPKIVRKEIQSGLKRKYYEVMNKFSAVFDASSGRLVTQGYFPFAVSEVGEELNSE